MVYIYGMILRAGFHTLIWLSLIKTISYSILFISENRYDKR